MRIFDVIRNDSLATDGSVASGSTLVWKFTGEDFMDKSQLIVQESEEAVFFRDGLALEVFPGGRYTLETANHPFLSRLRSWLSGGQTAYTAQVYFVNKAHRLELKWGTDSPIQVRDPIWGMATKVTARGSYSIRIADSKKFLIKLVGNVRQISEQELNAFYRSAFSQYIKDAIADHLMSSGEEILNVANKKTQLAAGIVESLRPILDEYGVDLVHFYVASIDIPDDDYRAKVEGSIADRQVKMQGALGDVGVMNILGENWGRQQSAEILRDLANNPGAGGVAAAGAGMGLGMAAGGVFNDMARNLVVPPGAPNPEPTPTTPTAPDRGDDLMPAEPPTEVVAAPCPHCGTVQPDGKKFCSDCGGALVLVCQECGQSARAGTKFCSECGSRFGGAQ